MFNRGEKHEQKVAHRIDGIRLDGKKSRAEAAKEVGGTVG